MSVSISNDGGGGGDGRTSSGDTAGRQEQYGVTLDWIDEPLTTFDVPVTTNLDYEITGNVEKHTDQCGTTKVDVNGDSGITLVIEGMVTDEQKDTILEARRRGAFVEVVNPIETGRFQLMDTTISKTADGNFLKRTDPETGETTQDPVFSIQLQLKEVKAVGV